nr:hypothetical protein [Tanacetum cinerariifolium]
MGVLQDGDPKQAQRDKDMQKSLALIAKTVNVAGAREKVGSPVVQQSGIQWFNCKEFRHFAKECRKPKKGKRFCVPQGKDVAELEAHYSYMAKIQEVPTADTSTNSEPVDQNDQNDVESDDERVALVNLKLDVDENKRIQNMHVPWVLGMRTVASISATGIPQKILIDHGLYSFWSHVVRVGWWWSLSPSGSDHDLSNHKR